MSLKAGARHHNFARGILKPKISNRQKRRITTHLPSAGKRVSSSFYFSTQHKNKTNQNKQTKKQSQSCAGDLQLLYEGVWRKGGEKQ